ncbi:ankyrin repeat domain protein [Histomonas meleagridis]|uniref:ankyrin repeat domain protein n=1 Tax=Histomonas meleagridis TaxID=135588 RepID=UPI003559F66D|nr:ankyrin repeat domain protein [Histomonas meleagridis]KAH0800224.1 ankyrin repeat domain protein [Histomonas meleagridis]
MQSENIAELEKILMNQSHFEELVFHLNASSFDEAKSLLNQYDKMWVQQLIVKAQNPLNYKVLGDLFELTGKAQIKFSSDTSFHQYLYVRGLITPDDFRDKELLLSKSQLPPVSTFENPIMNGEIEDYIQKDDLQGFVDYVIANNVDLHEEGFLLNDSLLGLIDFCCYCNSINILKFLLENDVEIYPETINSAVDGGSEEVISYLESIGISFDQTIIHAIAFHHNNIAKTLFKKYENKGFKLSRCVQWFNTEMLIYFINECDLDVNQEDNGKRTCLHYAVYNNDLNVVNYLLIKGADKNLVDDNGNSAMDFARTEKMKNLIK